MGEFIGDAGRDITGFVGDLVTASYPLGKIFGCFVCEDTLSDVCTAGSMAYKSNIHFAPNYPVANEFRSASISVGGYISY